MSSTATAASASAATAPQPCFDTCTSSVSTKAATAFGIAGLLGTLYFTGEALMNANYDFGKGAELLVDLVSSAPAKLGTGDVRSIALVVSLVGLAVLGIMLVLAAYNWATRENNESVSNENSSTTSATGETTEPVVSAAPSVEGTQAEDA